MKPHKMAFFVIFGFFDVLDPPNSQSRNFRKPQFWRVHQIFHFQHFAKPTKPTCTPPFRQFRTQRSSGDSIFQHRGQWSRQRWRGVLTSFSPECDRLRFLRLRFYEVWGRVTEIIVLKFNYFNKLSFITHYIYFSIVIRYYFAFFLSQSWINPILAFWIDSSLLQLNTLQAPHLCEASAHTSPKTTIKLLVSLCLA